MLQKRFVFAGAILAAVMIVFLAGMKALSVVSGKTEIIRESICVEKRRLIENSEENFFLTKGEHSASMQELVDQDFLENIPRCPSGGDYTWMPFSNDDTLYQTIVVCSVHKPFGQQISPVELDTAYINGLENGWHQLSSSYSITEDEMRMFDSVTDIMIIGDNGMWETHTKKGNRFPTLKEIPANIAFWIYKQQR